MRHKRKNSFMDLYRYYERPEKLSDKIKNNIEVISFVTAVIGILVALVIGIANIFISLSDNTNDCETQQESIPIVKELEVYQVYYHELGLALIDDGMKKTSQELLDIAREVYFISSNNTLIIVYRIG
ncbi:MAG: hypothetical protein ACRCX2_35885 [Paraclostridium sp.]